MASNLHRLICIQRTPNSYWHVIPARTLPVWKNCSCTKEQHDNSAVCAVEWLHTNNLWIDLWLRIIYTGINLIQTKIQGPGCWITLYYTEFIHVFLLLFFCKLAMRTQLHCKQHSLCSSNMKLFAGCHYWKPILRLRAPEQQPITKYHWISNICAWFLRPVDDRGRKSGKICGEKYSDSSENAADFEHRIKKCTQTCMRAISDIQTAHFRLRVIKHAIKHHDVTR